MLSSAIHISERSLTRLVVICPPYYWIGFIFLGVALFILVAGFMPSDPNTKAVSNMKWFTVAVATPFVLAGIALTTSQTRVVFDRGANSMRTETHAFGLAFRATSVPLEQIRQAVLETNARRGQALSVRLRSGELIRLAGASTQQGYGQAVSAINEFLGRPN